MESDDQLLSTECAKHYEYVLDNKRIINIYANDLKYKSFSNIKSCNILDKTARNTNCDTLEYRLEQCSLQNYDMLDLSHLLLKTLNFSIIDKKSMIKYLFLSNNNLSNLSNFSNIILDFSSFSNLLVLDLSSCSLEKLPTLPTRLEELFLRDNSITDISVLSELTKLKRLDCTSNSIIKFPTINSLEILIASHNNIQELPLLKNLIKLSITNNKLNTIVNYPNLLTLECDFNRITTILQNNTITELYCSRNMLKSLPSLLNISIIHCYNNPIVKFDYYTNLKQLLCDYNEHIDLSSHYKILDIDVYKNKMSLINFK